MYIIKKSHTITNKINDSFTATEYHSENKNINFGIVELSGRYPEEGRVMNEISTELVYIKAGSGKVVIEGVEDSVLAGDVVIIKPGEKYFWEGDFTFMISSTPAWNPEQHKKV